MVSFPPAKLNIGLHILDRREDGYHNLESIFLPIGWTDILEVTVNENVPRGEASFTWTGLNIPGDEDSNLVVRAHQLMAKDNDIPGLSIHLHKTLPMGAGLGGGSADGTHALRAINDLCHLAIPHEKMTALAAELGSDCPFFLQDGPAFISGRGEIVTPLKHRLNCHGFWVVVANPGIHVGTADAFSGVTSMPRTTNWQSLENQPVNSWSDLIQNDFEPSIAQRHPEVQTLLDIMKGNGASYTQMTGSGSTVFGLFEDQSSATETANQCSAGYCGRIEFPHC